MLTMRQLSRSLVALWCAANPLAVDLVRRMVPAGLFQFLYSPEVAPKERALLLLQQQRDNLSLAMEHTSESGGQSTGRQLLLHKGKRLQRQIMNAQSVRVIEKQLSSVMQHWKQRVGSGAPVGNGKQRLVIAVFKKNIQLTNAVTAEQNFLG